MANTDSKAVVDVTLEAYWQAAEEGRLLLKECKDCGKTHYYPRPLCPFCMSEATEWREASGAGEVYSFSVERRAEPPHAIAYVTLAEGPTILSSIVNADFDLIEIGAKVRLHFENRDDQPVPVFELA